MISTVGTLAGLNQKNCQKRKTKKYDVSSSNKAIGFAVIVTYIGEEATGGSVAAPIAEEILVKVMPMLMKQDNDKNSK